MCSMCLFICDSLSLSFYFFSLSLCTCVCMFVCLCFFLFLFLVSFLFFSRAKKFIELQCFKWEHHNNSDRHINRDAWLYPLRCCSAQFYLDLDFLWVAYTWKDVLTLTIDNYWSGKQRVDSLPSLTTKFDAIYFFVFCFLWHFSEQFQARYNRLFWCNILHFMVIKQWDQHLLNRTHKGRTDKIRSGCFSCPLFILWSKTIVAGERGGGCQTANCVTWHQSLWVFSESNCLV